MKKRLLLVVLSFCVFNVKSANYNKSSNPILGTTSSRQHRQGKIIFQPENTHESPAAVRRNIRAQNFFGNGSTEQKTKSQVPSRSVTNNGDYLVPSRQRVTSEYDTAVYMSKPVGPPRLRAATSQPLSNRKTNDPDYLVPVPLSQSVAPEYDTAVYMSKPVGQPRLRAATSQPLSNRKTNDPDYLVPVPINKKNRIDLNLDSKDDELIFDDLKKMIDEEQD